jgi:hypothetical protein
VNYDFYNLEFRPEQGTLRSQFLQMLLAVAGIQAANYTNEPPFPDVQALEPTPDFNLCFYVEAGLENGIIQGVSPRLFAPHSPLTRAQAVTIVMRAAKAFLSRSFRLGGWSCPPPVRSCPTWVAWVTSAPFTPKTCV